jgi:hypothetical protein
MSHHPTIFRNALHLAMPEHNSTLNAVSLK